MIFNEIIIAGKTVNVLANVTWKWVYIAIKLLFMTIMEN